MITNIRTITADTTNLACVLSILPEENIDEIIPEPFRMQKNFAVVIPYNTFKEYMQNYPSEYPDPNIVFSGIDYDKLKKDLWNLPNTEKEVLSCYYKSLAMAQAKEYIIADHYGNGATLIYSEIRGKNVTDREDQNIKTCVSEESYKRATERLSAKMAEHGLKLPLEPKRDYNKKVLDLAAYYEAITDEEEG